MNRSACFCLAALLGVVTASAPAAHARTVWLQDLDLSKIKQGWGKPQVAKSVQGRPMRLQGTTYEHGVGSHAPGAFYVELDGKTTAFHTVVGVDDDSNGPGSIRITIVGDGRVLLRTPVLRTGDKPAAVDLDLTGINTLSFKMDEGGDNNSFDHVDWADAKFTVQGADPKLVPRSYPPEPKVIRTPKPPLEPRINGPRVCGVRPGNPFIFRIPTTGERPIQFSAQGLPAGLALNQSTGIITGTVADKTKQTYKVTLTAENGRGKAARELRIAVGDTLALTPPMGWNDWYAHYDRITGDMMRQAADLMVSTGMADVGYQYVDIDDCWMNFWKNDDPKRRGTRRDDQGNILPNAYFPDMAAMTAYIHDKGLRAGLYTSPGPQTCAGCEGSWEHEGQDARQFAAWGFDFLKYDWCSYTKKAADKSLGEMKKPYIKMGDILKTLDRDIVLNLCQYGMGDVWKWGADVGGQCWRTSGDLGFEVDRYHDVARRNAEHWQYVKPGAWNDPDYLLIGYVGAASEMGEPIPCALSPNEQYSYMSLWCLMAAPLFYSGDMTKLDDFTLSILCNPEVIDIDQDPLGVGGHPVITRDDDTEIWTKPLEDGSLAVGLFNRADTEQPVQAKWSELGLSGKQRVRDLWYQKDLGVFDESYSAPVGRNGVMLLRVWPEK